MEAEGADQGQQLQQQEQQQTPPQQQQQPAGGAAARRRPRGQRRGGPQPPPPRPGAAQQDLPVAETDEEDEEEDEEAAGSRRRSMQHQVLHASLPGWCARLCGAAHAWPAGGHWQRQQQAPDDALDAEDEDDSQSLGLQQDADPLYDPDADERDEQWVRQRRQGRTSDAILSW